MDVNLILKEFLIQNKSYLYAYLVFLFAFPVSSVILPQLYSNVLDDLKEKKEKPRFVSLIICLFITTGMFRALDYIDSNYIPKLQAYVRKNIVKRVLDNFQDNFDEQEYGQLLSQIIKFPVVVKELFTKLRNHICPTILILVFVALKFILIDKRVGAIFLVGLVSIFYYTIKSSYECVKLASHLNDTADQIYENITELFENMIDIYSSNRINDEIEQIDNEQKNMIKDYKNAFNCTNKINSIMTTGYSIIMVFCIYYCYKLYQSNKIDFTSMLTVSIIGFFTIKKFSVLSSELPDLIYNLGVYNKTRSYLLKLDNLSKYDNKEVVFSNGRVIFKDVSIKYGDKQIINNFNLDIKPKECISIVGKIGSGKSTLIKALLRLINYDGNIIIDDINIKDINVSTLRSNIVFIRQNPIPFNRTFYENIVYGADNVSKDDVIKILDKYNLNNYFNIKLDEKVGKKGSKMSGGQRMLMFLLRIIINNNKKIVILDEPTSSLDEQTSNKVIELIKVVTKNQTTIIVTHDTKFNNIVDRVIELKN